MTYTNPKLWVDGAAIATLSRNPSFDLSGNDCPRCLSIEPSQADDQVNHSGGLDRFAPGFEQFGFLNLNRSFCFSRVALLSASYRVACWFKIIKFQKSAIFLTTLD